jgi:Glutathione S-transferase, N-terminal domain
VLWLLEEMGLALRTVDLRHRGDDAEFLKINPAGFLPAIQDGGVVMVESIAIMEYRKRCSVPALPTIPPPWRGGHVSMPQHCGCQQLGSALGACEEYSPVVKWLP